MKNNLGMVLSPQITKLLNLKLIITLWSYMYMPSCQYTLMLLIICILNWSSL